MEKKKSFFLNSSFSKSELNALYETIHLKKKESVFLKEQSDNKQLFIKNGFILYIDKAHNIYDLLKPEQILPTKTHPSKNVYASVQLQAITQTEILVIDMNIMEKLFLKYDKQNYLYFDYLMNLHNQLILDQQRFKHLDLIGKTVHTLLNFKPFTKIESKYFIPNHLNHSQIAKILGVSRESISRIFKGFIKNKTLTKTPKGYLIHDMATFELLAIPH